MTFGGHLVVSISICHEIGLVHLAINLTGLRAWCGSSSTRRLSILYGQVWPPALRVSRRLRLRLRLRQLLRAGPVSGGDGRRDLTG